MITTFRIKNNKSDEPMTENKNHLVHFWWVIFLLFAVIIILTGLLLTDIHCFENRIMTFLSFTATLLSIVLSIFAIMYSFYSMQEASRQWNDVAKAVNTINNYTDALNKSTQLLLEQVIKINRDLGSMQEKINVTNEIQKPQNTTSLGNIVNSPRLATPTTTSRRFL